MFRTVQSAPYQPITARSARLENSSICSRTNASSRPVLTRFSCLTQTQDCALFVSLHVKVVRIRHTTARRVLQAGSCCATNVWRTVWKNQKPTSGSTQTIRAVFVHLAKTLVWAAPKISATVHSVWLALSWSTHKFTSSFPLPLLDAPVSTFVLQASSLITPHRPARTVLHPVWPALPNWPVWAVKPDASSSMRLNVVWKPVLLSFMWQWPTSASTVLKAVRPVSYPHNAARRAVLDISSQRLFSSVARPVLKADSPTLWTPPVWPVNNHVEYALTLLMLVLHALLATFFCKIGALQSVHAASSQTTTLTAQAYVVNVRPPVQRASKMHVRVSLVMLLTRITTLDSVWHNVLTTCHYLLPTRPVQTVLKTAPSAHPY